MKRNVWLIFIHVLVVVSALWAEFGMGFYVGRVSIRPGASTVELLVDIKYTFLLSNLDSQVNLHENGLMINGGVGFVF